MTAIRASNVLNTSGGYNAAPGQHVLYSKRGSGSFTSPELYLPDQAMQFRFRMTSDAHADWHMKTWGGWKYKGFYWHYDGHSRSIDVDYAADSWGSPIFTIAGQCNYEFNMFRDSSDAATLHGFYYLRASGNTDKKMGICETQMFIDQRKIQFQQPKTAGNWMLEVSAWV